MPIDRGCVYEKTGLFQDRSTAAPIDITAWEFEASLRNAAGEEVLAMSTGGGQFEVVNGENGELRIRLTPEETAELEPGPVSFVLYRTDGERARIGRGEELVRAAE